MSEIGLVPIPEHDPNLSSLRDHFNGMVRQATRTKESLRRFPGTMPLTLSRRHLGMVAKNDYVALEKSDGTRYMLFVVSETVFLIDRSFRFYIVEPSPQILSHGFQACQENTILDGELTHNQILDKYEYLIYDSICINGDISVASRGFRERMLAAENYVAGPRAWAPFYAGLLRIRIKDYYEIKDIRRLFSHIRKDPSGQYLYMNNNRRDGVICNENDGVIFAPVGIGYQVKKCSALLKWKPPHLNSIDFLLQLEKTVDARRNNEPTVTPYIAYKGDRGNIRLREVYFPSKLKRKWAADFRRYHNSIVELAYDRMAGEWRYLRNRDDKDSANFASTVIDTMETITESMEREELVTHCERHATPPPAQEKEFVVANKNNAKCCTFEGDLFDDSNHDYLLTTPISLVAPPFMAPPAGKRFDRGRRRQPVSDDFANGRKTRSHPTSETEQNKNEDRPPVAYDDDV